MPARRKLRILHGPSNVASVASVLARAQRARGLDAHAICSTTGRGISPDAVLGQRGPSGKRFAPFMLSEFPAYDVFHFYYDETYFGRSFFEINVLRRLGKKVILTFLGCDIRDSRAELAKTGPSICQQCWPEGCARNRKQLLRAAQEADAVFVTTPDLLAYVPGARWLPLPVASDLIVSHEMRLRAFAPDDPLVVFHAPTDPQKKGTAHLEAAIRRLQAGGAPVRLELPKAAEQEKIWQQAARADIAVDQLLSGVYGTFGAEMMVAGIPLINHIDPSAWQEIPAGIIEAGPDSVEAVLGNILGGKTDLRAQAAAAQAYAVSKHAAEAVITAFDDIYSLEPA